MAVSEPRYVKCSAMLHHRAVPKRRELVVCVRPQAQDNTQRRADLDHVTGLDHAD